MSGSTFVRRISLSGAAAVAAVALAAGPALAHHCFVPMYTLQGPSSPNWFVVTAEEGAMLEVGYTVACPGAADAGYAALQEAGLPVAIKIFEKMTIGDPKGGGRMNPNGADGHGLEYFAAGSELPFQMVGTFISGAESYTCDA